MLSLTTRALWLAVLLPCALGAQPEIPDAKPPVSTFSLPDTLRLCGERVPLERPDVRERLEREFFYNLDREGQLVLYLKRAGRSFPVVERIVRELGLPDDLKYVPVAESGLHFRAASPADAVGYWQFVKGTATRYGLKVGTYVDERRDLERSTRAACAYLKDLRDEFGSWAAALAAYNWGEQRLERALSEQNTSSYYDLYLPDETDRFVFRIACLKLIMANPQGYDIYIPHDGYYLDPQPEYVDITSKSWLQIASLAFAAGVSAREFRHLNPWMNANTLPQGTYRFAVPASKAQGFAERLSGPRSGLTGSGSAVEHIVRVGDSLTRLAAKYSVSLEDLERWNGITRAEAIHPGQRIIVGNPAKGPG